MNLVLIVYWNLEWLLILGIWKQLQTRDVLMVPQPYDWSSQLPLACPTGHLIHHWLQMVTNSLTVLFFSLPSSLHGACCCSCVICGIIIPYNVIISLSVHLTFDYGQLCGLHHRWNEISKLFKMFNWSPICFQTAPHKWHMPCAYAESVYPLATLLLANSYASVKAFNSANKICHIGIQQCLYS